MTAAQCEKSRCGPCKEKERYAAPGLVEQAVPADGHAPPLRRRDLEEVKAVKVTRLHAMLERYGEALREVVLDCKARELCAAALLQLPSVQARLAAGWSFDVFAVSVPMLAIPFDAVGLMWDEACNVFARQSAVLIPRDGGVWGKSQLRAGGLVVQMLAASRINSTTGGSGFEGIMQEMLGGYARGWRLWSYVNGAGALLAPDLAQVLAVAWLPPAFRAQSRITDSLPRYEKANAALGAGWAAKMLKPADVAAGLRTLEAANPGRMAYLNMGELDAALAWGEYQRIEHAFFVAQGCPVSAPKPPPDTWNRVLVGAKVLATGWDVAGVPGLAARLKAAGATVIPKGTGSQHSLLVYNDQWRQHARLAAAMHPRSGIQVITRAEFLAHVASLPGGGAARGAAGGVAGGAAPGAARGENAEPNSPRVKRRRLVIDSDDEDA